MPKVEKTELHKFAQERAHRKSPVEGQEDGLMARMVKLVDDINVFVPLVNESFPVPRVKDEGIVLLISRNWKDSELPDLVKMFLTQEQADHPHYQPAILTRTHSNRHHVEIGFVTEGSVYQSGIVITGPTASYKGVSIFRDTSHDEQESPASELAYQSIEREYYGETYEVREQRLLAAEEIFNFALAHVVHNLDPHSQE